MMAVLLATCVLLYVLLILLAALRVQRQHIVPADALTAPPLASVLVAARDEAVRLPRCLAALAAQDYPAHQIEFIIADDQSSDATPDLIRAAARRDARFRYVAVPPDKTRPGKANALQAAYQASSGDVLLITDADCAPPPHWARTMAAQFTRPNVGIVCGATRVEHHTILERLQALDWLFLLSIAAAATPEAPLSAMGNNMALRRATFETVGGYSALPHSVTEDFVLFQAVHARTPWQALLHVDPGLANRTEPVASLGAMFAQRRRWARGGVRAPLRLHLVYGLALLTHGFLLAGLLFQPVLGLIGLAFKITADFILIEGSRRRLGERGLSQTFPLFQLYLFAYLLALPFALLLRPRIVWKARRF